MLQELRGDRVGVDALGHEVVTLVAQHADDLRGQRLVEQLDHGLAVGPVSIGDRAFFDVLPRPATKLGDVGHERLVSH